MAKIHVSSYENLRKENEKLLQALENCYKALHEIIMSNPEYYGQEAPFQEEVIEAKRVINEVKENIDG